MAESRFWRRAGLRGCSMLVPEGIGRWLRAALVSLVVSGPLAALYHYALLRDLPEFRMAMSWILPSLLALATLAALLWCFAVAIGSKKLYEEQRDARRDSESQFKADLVEAKDEFRAEVERLAAAMREMVSWTTDSLTWESWRQQAKVEVGRVVKDLSCVVVNIVPGRPLPQPTELRLRFDHDELRRSSAYLQTTGGAVVRQDVKWVTDRCDGPFVYVSFSEPQFEPAVTLRVDVRAEKEVNLVTVQRREIKPPTLDT